MSYRADHWHLSALVLMASVLVLPPAVAESSPPAAQLPEVTAALTVLDAWIAATVASREVPGLSIGIVSGQDLLWAKGYGLADLERKIPATASTVYRIGSISKLFTATAIMQLRDRGHLRLDDAVETSLPWFRLAHVDPDDPKITIRDLLTHLSGLPRDAPTPYWNDLNFPTRAELIHVLPSQEVVFPPATEWKYSNLAFAIAGEVLATVSREPYAEYVTRHILTPLGMTATTVTPTATLPDLAVGYERRVPGAPRAVAAFTETRALAPAANLASSVEDLAKFVALQLRDGPAGGTQILRGATLREMQRVQWLEPSWRRGQGIGFAIRRVSGHVRIGQGGSVRGYQARLEIEPARQLGVIVLTNANDERPLRYVDQAFALVGPALARALDQPKPPSTPDLAWAHYVGTYGGSHFDSDVQVLVLNGELTLLVPDADDPWDARVTLTPVAPGTFRLHGGGSNGELLRFEVDATGQATQLTAGNVVLIRK
jgi:D-alanyl-D-alanine carboxypeptidase